MDGIDQITLELLMNKQNNSEAYKLPFTQLLLCNSDDMLSNSNRVDQVSPAVAD